ncbi:hypothetical protein EMCRGX_G029917 [Ephydatia muelleri]
MLRRELHYLSDTDRQALLNEAGVVSRIGAQEALAIKAGMGMPLAKLRLLRRLLVSPLLVRKGCECKRHHWRKPEVCLPGLHITQGIFTKIYELLENACHSLDLQLALVSHAGSTTSNFTHYSNELKKLQAAKLTKNRPRVRYLLQSNWSLMSPLHLVRKMPPWKTSFSMLMK